MKTRTYCADYAKNISDVLGEKLILAFGKNQYHLKRADGSIIIKALTANEFGVKALLFLSNLEATQGVSV